MSDIALAKSANGDKPKKADERTTIGELAEVERLSKGLRPAANGRKTIRETPCLPAKTKPMPNNGLREPSQLGSGKACFVFLQTVCKTIPGTHHGDRLQTAFQVLGLGNSADYSLPPDMKRAAISEALRLIFQGIEQLKEAFPNRAFTIDGRLVGDVGEVIAALEYDVVLHDVSQPNHDAITSDGRSVQIKATFKDSLTYKTVPDYYLGFKLYPDGRHEEIFNGPGKLIYDRYVARKGVGAALLSFPVTELRKLSEQVAQSDRIPKRSG